MIKKCLECNELKPIEDFWKHSGRKDGRVERCKPCSRKLDKGRWHKRKDHQKNYVLEKTYGITLNEYQNLRTFQENKCAICGCEVMDVTGRELAVDHCHKSGKVRGLLCSNCNLGLGSFKDDPELLTKAIEYLVRTF